MSIKSVDEARVVTGYHQHAAGTIDAVAPVKGSGSVVMIQAEAVNVRYRADGVDPTTTVGVLLAAGECHTLNVGAGNIANIKVIGIAVNAILNVTAFR
jgi:hypothetical protein